MAIGSSDVTSGPFLCNGATVTFSFNFRVADYGDVAAADQIKVILVTTATGAETVLTEGVSAGQYGVSVNADQDTSPGGSITTVSAYASGYKIYIRLKPSFTQQTELTNQGPYNADVVEAQFDQTTRQILDLRDKVRRSPVLGLQIGESFDGEITGTPQPGYILVPNAGLTGFEWVANNGSSNLVTATGSITARTLADRFSDAYRPEDFGAVGDGSTNDTTALQACLNALGEGDCVLLKPGAVYSVTNITLPTNAAALSSGIRNGLVCIGGMATIKCRSGGSTDYMVATDRWLTASADKTGIGSPWLVENVNFDANGIAARTVVSKNFWTHWDGCYFQGATTTNFEFTRQNQDTSDGHNNSFLSDCMWRHCRFRGAAATHHFRTRGTAANENAAPSDGTLDGCEFSQAADYGAYIATAAGWTIHTNRFYSQTSAGLYVLRLGRGHSIADNNFDSDGSAPAVIVGEVGSYPDGMIGPGNKYYADLRVDFKDDNSNERVKVRGDHFFTLEAGTPDAVVIHNCNRAEKTLTIQSCDFEADPVYERAVGNTAGIIEVFDCTSASASGDAKTIAYLRDDSGATAGPVVRGVRRSASPASNDILRREEHIGDDSAGNLATYVAEEAYIVTTTNGGEAGGYRVKVQKGGSETTAIDATGNGLEVLGSSTWRILASSAATGMSHTGDTNATTLATISVPANAIGANGRVRVRTLWTLTNNGNNKTLRVNFGGTTFQTQVSASQASYRMETEICNRNSAASQISNSVQAQGGWGNTTNAAPTGTVDTTSAQNVTITAQLATGTDTATLEAYIVEVFYKA